MYSFKPEFHRNFGRVSPYIEGLRGSSKVYLTPVSSVAKMRALKIPKLRPQLSDVQMNTKALTGENNKILQSIECKIAITKAKQQHSRTGQQYKKTQNRKVGESCTGIAVQLLLTGFMGLFSHVVFLFSRLKVPSNQEGHQTLNSLILTLLLIPNPQGNMVENPICQNPKSNP